MATREPPQFHLSIVTALGTRCVGTYLEIGTKTERLVFQEDGPPPFPARFRRVELLRALETALLSMHPNDKIVISDADEPWTAAKGVG